MGNILHNNRDLFNFRINKDEYWDFCLSNDNGITDSSTGLTTDCLVSYIDTTNPDCVWFNDLTSIEDYYWEDAVSTDITLNYIGYTGMDNGYISYEKDRISNQIFYNLFKNSKLTINEGDYKLKLHKVNGNNQIYDYQCDIVEEDNMIVAKMNGGFYQGFFETNCDEYKILPDTIDDGWSFETTLKKRDFDETSQYTLNEKYPANKGIFLYIGTRAENKWWKLYNVDHEFESANNSYLTDGYVNDDYIKESDMNISYLTELTEGSEVEIKKQNMLQEGYVLDYFNKDYFNNTCSDKSNTVGYEFSDSKECTANNKRNNRVRKIVMPHPYFLNTYQDNAIWYTREGCPIVSNEKEISRCNTNSFGMKYDCCKSYFKDEYVKDEYYNTDTCDVNCNKYTKETYVNDELYIDKDETLYTSDGYSFNELGVIEYKTNNKFMFFDRTCDGYNVNKWNSEKDEYVIVTDIKVPDGMENYFLLFNRTCHGYNIQNIEDLINEKNKEYNILKDLFKNALAFQITDDGAVGYKYLVQDCDAEDWEYKIKSEFTSDGIVTEDEWHVINIKIVPINSCSVERDKTMQISIYVDGKIRLISQELPMLKLHQLNDTYDKQQGVPFNISLGGGTQGLCDVIYLDYLKLPEYILPLEKNFAGSFVGYIKSFKMYNCVLNYKQIKNNYDFEMKSIK